jgi:predicted phosphodiesterase
LWGWWKKPLEPPPDPGLTVLQRELEERAARLRGEYPNQDVSDRMPWIYCIDSANRILYRARLLEIYYKPGGELMEPPKESRPPDYYRDRQLPAWFRVGFIERVPPEGGGQEEGVASSNISYLDRFVWSRLNRTTPIQSYTSLPEEAVGKGVLDKLGKGFDFLDSNVSLWFLTPTQEEGLFRRSDVVESLSRTIWPAKGRYALHLSDLHFGLGHGFRNQLATEKGNRLGRESLLEALLRDLKALKITESQIALVLVTGDLTWQGDAHEFANALNFLKALCNELGLHTTQVVVVPGNHDIEWRDDKGDIDENANYNYYQFSKNFYVAEPKPEEMFLRIHRFDILGRPVCIIGLNSCRIENKENAGLGYVGREQLETALRFLHDLYPPKGHRPQNELRIALVHHHLMPVNFIEDIEWKDKRVSIMLDAEGVLRSLMFAGVRMILHGHQHQPFASDVRRIVNGFVDPFEGKECALNSHIAIIGGGSVGVERKYLNIVGRNSYNIIDLACEGDRVNVQTRIQSPVGPGFSDYYDSVDFDLALCSQ